MLITTNLLKANLLPKNGRTWPADCHFLTSIVLIIRAGALKS